MEPIVDLQVTKGTIYRVITSDGAVLRYSPEEWAVTPLPVGLQLIKVDSTRFVLMPWQHIVRFDAMPGETPGYVMGEKDVIPDAPF